MSFLGIYICLEVEYKGNVSKTKCCLIIMRCLCQVVAVAVILFLPFVLVFQMKLTKNACSFSAPPCFIVKLCPLQLLSHPHCKV